MACRRRGPEIVWRLPYKSDGLGYTLGESIQLFLIDTDSGDVTQLTSGPFESRGASAAPDGTQVAFSRTQDGRFANRTDIWCVPTDGDSPPRRLTFDVSTAQYPVWSPSGAFLVFSGSADEGDAQVRLWVIDMKDGSNRPLGDEGLEVVDGSAVYWDDDGAGLTLIVARRGLQEVGHITFPEGEYRTVNSGLRHVSALTPAAGGRLAFVAESPTQANQLFLCDRDGRTDTADGTASTDAGSAQTQLSRINGWWSERRQVAIDLRDFEVPDGDGGNERVQGWIVRDANAGAAGPLLIDVHGGPASYALLAYTSHVYWNVLANRGWTILSLNAVGSSSYGRDFSARLRGRWGDLDLTQILAAAERIKDSGECDGRMAITGKSYGGYVAAWALARPAGVRCAVVASPVTNIESHYGTSDSGYYADPYEMRAEPWKDPDRYADASPSRHTANVRAPLLIIQGKDDQRCPNAQSEDYFVRVMRATDVPAEMVLYPGASHHFYDSGLPAHRIDYATRLVNWLERWIDRPC